MNPGALRASTATVGSSFQELAQMHMSIVFGFMFSIRGVLLHALAICISLLLPSGALDGAILL